MGRGRARREVEMSNADFIAFWVIAVVIIWLAVCALIWLATEEWS
jgi:hypothetical protein